MFQKILKWFRKIWDWIRIRYAKTEKKPIGKTKTLKDEPKTDDPPKGKPINDEDNTREKKFTKGEKIVVEPPPPPPPPPPPSPSPPCYYPTNTLFTNPDPKIYDLQKKILQILFLNLNLIITREKETVIYLPSRLVYYLEKEDAFSAFQHFLNHFYLTPKDLIKNDIEREFIKKVIIGLFDVDVCRWGTNLSDQPFYNLMRESRNFERFYHLLDQLDQCSTFLRQLQDDKLNIAFYDFHQFKEAVMAKFDKWEKINSEDFDLWDSLIEEYKIAYGKFQNYWYSIKNDLNRLEKIDVNESEEQVINNLIQEAEEVNNQLLNGLTDVVNGLSHLQELADIISGFVDEIFTKRKESKSSSKDKKSSGKEKETKTTQDVYWALKILGLTSLESLTLKDLKSARNTQAKKYHPDVGGTNEDMINVSNAYDILKSYLEKK